MYKFIEKTILAVTVASLTSIICAATDTKQNSSNQIGKTGKAYSKTLSQAEQKVAKQGMDLINAIDTILPNAHKNAYTIKSKISTLSFPPSMQQQLNQHTTFISQSMDKINEAYSVFKKVIQDNKFQRNKNIATAADTFKTTDYPGLLQRIKHLLIEIDHYTGSTGTTAASTTLKQQTENLSTLLSQLVNLYI